MISATQEHEDGPLEVGYVVLHSSHFLKKGTVLQVCQVISDEESFVKGHAGLMFVQHCVSFCK